MHSSSLAKRKSCSSVTRSFPKLRFENLCRTNAKITLPFYTIRNVSHKDGAWNGSSSIMMMQKICQSNFSKKLNATHMYHRVTRSEYGLWISEYGLWTSGLWTSEFRLWTSNCKVNYKKCCLKSCNPKSVVERPSISRIIDFGPLGAIWAYSKTFLLYKFIEML